MTILLAKRQLDPIIFARFLFEKWPKGRIGGSIVRDAKLPGFVNLTLDRFDCRREQTHIRIVNGQENGNQRLTPHVPKIAPKRHGIEGVKARPPSRITGGDTRIAFGFARRCVHEQIGEARCEFLQREMMLERPPRRRAQPDGQGPLGEAALDRARESVWIFRRYEQSIHFVPYPFRDPADIGADDDLAETHRFQNRDRHRFVA